MKPGKLKQLKSYYGLVFQNFNLFPALQRDEEYL